MICRNVALIIPSRVLWIERYTIVRYWELNQAGTDRIGWYELLYEIISDYRE
nr:MAG TPA: hypothetical protein [Caudoviricetes sp.]